ncbi:HAD hydrolase-like protein [Acetobacter papayae]|uniref:HAD hydrolase-like protein n=1 Tax=Acetobacter papayae TaxID=1076592 RepID=UPI000471A0BD|nr:HAD hydrolase-like protein [Acetobacter papayae]
MTVRRLAVFDMDGTLLDSLPDLAESCRELLAFYGLPVLSDTMIRTMIGRGVAVLVSKALAAARSLVGERAPVVDEAEAAARFMTLYMPRLTRLSRLFPGAEDALRALRNAGWELAVCTNKPEAAAREILHALDVADLFVAVGGGDSFAVKKPDPAHLLGTIAMAHGQADRSVMVGDMPPDWLAAEGAGCPFVYAAWGYGQQPPEGGQWQAGSMVEVPALLETILPV